MLVIFLGFYEIKTVNIDNVFSNYMVCYSKDAVKSENHKKPYFISFHYLLRARYIHVALCGSHDVKEESYFTNGRLLLCAVVTFLLLFFFSIRLRKLERNLELLNSS